MDNKAFDSKRIAQGYAKRPWLHKSVIEQIKKDCSLPNDYMFKRELQMKGCQEEQRNSTVIVIRKG